MRIDGTGGLGLLRVRSNRRRDALAAAERALAEEKSLNPPEQDVTSFSSLGYGSCLVGIGNETNASDYVASYTSLE